MTNVVNQIENLLNTREPDLELLANLTTSIATIKDIHCRVFLPRRVEEKPYLVFLPTADQEAALRYPPFKLQAQTAQNILHSDEVHPLGSKSKYWSSGIQVQRMLCEPWHFDFIEILDSEQPNTRPSNPEYLTLFVTNSDLLTPKITRHLHSDGSVDVKRLSNSQFELPSGISVDFANEVTLEEQSVGTLLIDKLVAKIEGPGISGVLPEITQEIDDLLLLTSLAERERCQCVGWHLSSGGILKTHYFGNRSIQNLRHPENRFRDYKLVEQQHFAEFMKTGLKSFAKVTDKIALRRAINALLHGIGPGVEDRVLTLFAGIETLVTAFRKEYALEFVVDEATWPKIERVIKQSIKQDPTHALSAEQRSRLYSKLRELNRVSFSDVLSEFRIKYSLDVGDLWTMTGRDSLAEVRNRIIHGATFTHTQMEALVTAKFHLQWHLERMLLAILDWPYVQSGAATSAIQVWSSYGDAAKACKQLAEDSQ